ncbi:MAG: polyphenol oxidase family protein [Pseudomonadota bacterium]
MTAPFFQKAANLSSPHGFFGRQGGVSDGIFSSLNGSFASGDKPDHVAENRRRMAKCIGADAITTARQTHSAKALFVSEVLPQDHLPEADALMTDVPGLAVAVLTADCVPLLFEAPGLVCAAHAGWRGSMHGIIGAAVAMMEDKGAKRATIRVSIGPCLRRDSFEVRHDLIAEVKKSHRDADPFFSAISDTQSLYDHVGFVGARLREAGVLPHNITDTGGDTLADQTRYFSYRGARKAGSKRFGHNLSAIMLPCSG